MQALHVRFSESSDALAHPSWITRGEIQRQWIPYPARQGGVIRQVIVGQRMHENREAGCLEHRKNPVQVGPPEMHLELRVTMRTYFAIAHLTHVQQTGGAVHTGVPQPAVK